MTDAPSRRLIVLTLAVAGLAACSPTHPPAPPSSPAASTPVVHAVAGINQKDRAQLTGGGVLRLGLVDWTDDWNPWTQDLSPQLSAVVNAVRPQLFDVSAAGALVTNPDWLAGPPEVSDEPVTQVTYRLNPAARWGDGQPVTADDFVATWQACLPAGPGPCRSGADFAHVTGVAAGATPQAVVVTYDRVEADWATTFRHGPARAGSLPQAWTDPAAVPGWFAGPFRVRALNRAARQLVLEPNPWWQGSPPLLDQVTATAYPADGLLVAYATGDIDAWPVDFDPGRYTAAAALDNLQVRRSPSDRWRVLVLRQRGVLADRQVRRALLQGLDRAVVGQAALPGIDWSATTLDHLAWQPGQAAYTNLAQSTGLGLDPAAAATMLDQAGWTLDDGGRRVKAGVPLTLTFLVDPDDPLSESEGLHVAAQLRALGVTVDLARPRPGEARSALTAGDFDLVSQTWRNNLNPATQLAARLGTGGTDNISGYANSAVDDWLAQAATTPGAGQAALITRAATLLWTDAAVIPLYVLPETWATRPSLANFGPTGLASQSWQNVSLT